jgi:hypothetical protein
MPTAYTKERKPGYPGDATLTWDDMTETWNEAEGTWNAPRAKDATSFSKESKPTTSFSKESKP